MSPPAVSDHLWERDCLGGQWGQTLHVVTVASLFSAAQPPFTMCFRVKFYPTDPAALKEEITR